MIKQESKPLLDPSKKDILPRLFFGYRINVQLTDEIEFDGDGLLFNAAGVFVVSPSEMGGFIDDDGVFSGFCAIRYDDFFTLRERGLIGHDNYTFNFPAIDNAKRANNLTSTGWLDKVPMLIRDIKIAMGDEVNEFIDGDDSLVDCGDIENIAVGIVEAQKYLFPLYMSKEVHMANINVIESGKGQVVTDVIIQGMRFVATTDVKTYKTVVVVSKNKD